MIYHNKLKYNQVEFSNLFLLFLLPFFLIFESPLFGIENADQTGLRLLISNECNETTEINCNACECSDVIVSSLSENAANAKKYLSISMNDIDPQRLESISSLAKGKGIDFCFWQINDSYIEIEPTDLLFLNSLGTYHHIHFALNTFAKNVRKYICIPNMYKEGIPQEREEHYTGNYLEYPQYIKRTDSKGVWRAVIDFLDTHPDWIFTKLQEAPDMLVLSRMEDTFVPMPLQLDPQVDFYLKNKIILCTGPSLGRYQMLKQNLESEMRLIPYKKIFVRTNDDQILNITFSNRKPDCKRIPCIEKYVDCWNCIIASLKDAIEDPEVCDDDIILFKHESVFLNDLGLFKRAINKLLSGSDMIVRTFWGGSTSDIFMVKASAIKKLIHYFSLLQGIPPDQYVEMMLHTQIVTAIPNVYCIHLGMAPFAPTNISTWGSNGFGFYHFHHYFKFSKTKNQIVDIFGQEFWKKENYMSLFDENHKICNHHFYISFFHFSSGYMQLRPDRDTFDIR